MKLLKTVYDCSTGITETRPMTEQEIADYEKAIAESNANRLAEEQAQAEREAAKAAAKSKLEALGLTPEEIAAITGA